jgi:hypothetical protein
MVRSAAAWPARLELGVRTIYSLGNSSPIAR